MKGKLNIKTILITALLVLSLPFQSNAYVGSTIYVDSIEESWFSEYSKYTDREFSLDIATSMFRVFSAEQSYLDKIANTVKNQPSSPVAFNNVNNCTAFLVAPDIALTASHCFFREGNTEPHPAILLSFTDPNKVIKSELIAIDRDNDIVALRIEPQKNIPLPIASTTPEGGSKVTVLGFPDSILFPFKNFQITSVETTTHPDNNIRLTVVKSEGNILMPKLGIMGVVRKGNSGGPVVNSNGEIVGLVNVIYPKMDITLAMKHSDIRTFLNSIDNK